MLIMGCDFLVDFLPDSAKSSIEQKVDLLKYAYAHGIRNFDISVCPNFIQAHDQFLSYTNNDITGFGNPNWKCGFKLKDQDLWDIQDRIRRTLLEQCFTKQELKHIFSLPKIIQQRWFLPVKEEPTLTKEEISEIYLDIDQFKNNLAMLKDRVKIVLFGSNYLEWLIKLGRLDLINQGLDIIKKIGFIPWSISHWPSVTAPIIRDLPFCGHWVHYNKLEQLIIPDDALKSIKQLTKPITVFRVLSCGELSNNPHQAVQFIIDTLQPDNLAIGIRTKEDIEKLSDISCI